MISELSFMLELIVDETVPAELKPRFVKRVKEIEKNYTTQPQVIVPRGTTKAQASVIAAQSPSMQRLMEQNPDLIPKPPVPETREAARALNARQALINGAMKGDDKEKRTSPRKF